MDRASMQIIRISIHALRKESDARQAILGVLGVGISIHALRKESDGTLFDVYRIFGISIHALRKESDSVRRATVTQLIFHQSSRSVRRATP